MKYISKVLFSYLFVIVLLTIMGAGAGVATFIENDFDTQTAKALVYDALWYEIVMTLLAISLIGIIFKSKMYRKPAAFMFHLGFIFVLIGAGITRYYGYEGMIHIREGKSENRVISELSYLQIILPNEVIRHPLRLVRLGNNDFEFQDVYKGKALITKFKDYKFTRGGTLQQLVVDVTYAGETKEVKIMGGHGSYEPPVITEFGDISIDLTWGSKLIVLPFEIKLKDFQLERYPGSESASSYASEVLLIDNKNNINEDFRIFMNNPLTYNGYKFFQSSYDKDEKGTILSVNYDPGKWPTYFAYGLLIIGFILNFFVSGTRVQKLKKFLKENQTQMTTTLFAILIAFSLFLPNNLNAEVKTVQKGANEEYFELFTKNSPAFAKEFSSIYVQDWNGRIKPLHTEARDVLNKMSQAETMFGLTPTQIMLGILSHPTYWEHTKLVRIKSKELKKLLKIDASQKYISFFEIFDEQGRYRLQKEIYIANAKDPTKRSKFDNDVIKLDERLNVFYLITQGIFLKFIPKPNDENNTWFDPQNVIYQPWLTDEAKKPIYDFMEGLFLGIKDNNWERSHRGLTALKKFQREVAINILPTENQTKAEIFLNEINIFKNLMTIYFILGFTILIYALFSIFKNSENSKLKNIFYSLIVISFIIHTIGLGLRWYVSGHAPWSDTYESLIYISWSAILAGVVIFRNSTLSLSSSFILGGIALFVANLTFLSPQITPLVPVLKSYWLSIHVSVITASYGFLALGALLSFISLILMIFKNSKNSNRINNQIRQLCAIIEISLIAGLTMLTVGNFAGGIWANESWGRYWSWDPKETWTLVTIVVYTVVVHLRFVPKLSSVYIFLISSLVSFSSVIMTYFGVNYYLSGMHSYAGGDKVPVPNFIYYLIALVIIISLIAYKGRDVKKI